MLPPGVHYTELHMGSNIGRAEPRMITGAGAGEVTGVGAGAGYLPESLRNSVT